MKAKSDLPVRVVTATSLFDGHDAAINVMRRIMQREGAEVVHLGHNRSVQEIVEAAIQEDAHAIAVSSYQGGHIEFFKYMVDRLRELGASRIKVFGGGGGTIVPEEIAELEAYGVAKIYGPESGQELGLVGMIQHLLAQARLGAEPDIDVHVELEKLPAGPVSALARLLTFNELRVAGHVNDEAGQFVEHQVQRLAAQQAEAKGGIPVLGFTGTGGAGKSSLTDEIVRRFLGDFEDKRVAILSIDPTQRRSGGALLGDRIRMNAVTGERTFMRSLATRQEHLALAASLKGAVPLCKAAGYDLILIETAGIGQSDTEIVDLADFTVYVMTTDYGAASQLEKIGMLDFADAIAINKFDKSVGQDALRDVRKQVRRNRGLFKAADDELPVYGTVASRFQDPATDRFYAALMQRMGQKLKLSWQSRFRSGEDTPPNIIIPPRRVR
jgi:methylmalonyl-CoA mutase